MLAAGRFRPRTRSYQRAISIAPCGSCRNMRQISGRVCLYTKYSNLFGGQCHYTSGSPGTMNMTNEMNESSISQILEVIERMAREIPGNVSEERAYRNAIQAAANTHNVDNTTVSDACTRRFDNIGVSEFRNLVSKAIRGDGNELKRKLIEHSNIDSHPLIEDFFRNQLQIRPVVGNASSATVQNTGELIGDFARDCSQVLHDYPNRPPSRSNEDPVFILIRDLGSKLERIAQRLVPNEHWQGKASSGSGDWAFTPWIAVFDTRVTQGASEGEYPVIHFLFNQEEGSPQGPGIRLGLGISTNYFRGDSRSSKVLQVARDLDGLIENQELQGFWFADSSAPRPTRAPSDRASLGYGYYEGMIMEKFIGVEDLGTIDDQFEYELKFLFDTYKRWVEWSAQNTSSVSSNEYTLANLARDTSIDHSELERWISAIDRKGQAILYGPPGTGKTYTARFIARYLSQRDRKKGIVGLVQFHPAYTYEDFMQGLRPVSEEGQPLTYIVKSGRFLDFCEEARGQEGTCVLIIDEINRANLSEVLGELMYLLEYRNESIALAVDGTDFEIPSNVRLLGTMNTADRSIALVDHALRRRFAFFRLAPNYQLLREAHAHTGFAVDGLITLLQRLNNAVDDSHFEVGVSFFLGSNLAESIQDIWQMEIEPYLEEYFFDSPDKIDEFCWDQVQSTVNDHE